MMGIMNFCKGWSSFGSFIALLAIFFSLGQCESKITEDIKTNRDMIASILENNQETNQRLIDMQKQIGVNQATLNEFIRGHTREHDHIMPTVKTEDTKF